MSAPPIKYTSAINVPWTHWFFYGDTGAGKTKTASTFPDPIIIVPTDENSIVTLMDQHLPYIEIYGQKGSPRTQGWGLDAAINWLEAELKAKGADFPYMTIVIEAVSHYLEQVQEEMTDGNKAQMDQRKWGQLASHLRNIHSRLRNMAVHVVFTALVKEDKDAADNATASPLMSGKMGYLLPSACDVIGYCVAEPGNPPRYDVHFAKYKHFRARTRFNRMPRKVQNFRYDDIEQYIVRPEAAAKAAE
jgi:hypothetical protein